MPWFKVDDHFDDHPKTQGLSLAAIGLWTLCGSFCSRRLTDGLVSRSKAVQYAKGHRTAERLAQELVDAGLWTVEGDGWRYHDWPDYQPTKAEVEAERLKHYEAKRRAGQMGGVRSGEVRKAKQEGSRNETEVKQERSRDEAEGQADGQAETKQNEAPIPIPIPIQLTPPIGGVCAPPALTPSPEAPRRRSGTRLPPDWTPSAPTLDRFRTQERVDASASLERFRNHFLAKPGKEGVKLDWEATFRNWVLEDIRRGHAVPYRERTAPKVSPEPEDPPPLTPEQQALMSEQAKAFGETLRQLSLSKRPKYLTDPLNETTAGRDEDAAQLPPPPPEVADAPTGQAGAGNEVP